jgi:preprotein translocase subunit YajC
MTALTMFFALQAPASGGGSSLLPLLFQFAAIGAIFYFLIIRPQQKQRKAHEERLGALKRGDSVVTAGGLVGEVVHIRELKPGATGRAALEDHVTIKSGESRVVVERGRIARVVGETSAPPTREG